MGKHGWGGKFLALFNTSIVFSWPATVVSAAVMAFPLMYMTTRGAFEQVDTNIENAARTLGASEWKVLYSVTLPLAWPGVLAGTILSFARALGEFGATLMIAGNIPGKTATIPVAIYFDIVDGNMKQANILMIIVIGIALTSLALLAYLKRPKPRSSGLVANPVPSDILAAGKKRDISS
jgi:molybdate transport system permease protein